MKDFDFVKFTLFVCLFLILVLAGLWVYLDLQSNELQRQLAASKASLETIGQLSGEIQRFQEELRQDRSREHDSPYTYFHEQASAVGIDANQDYQLTARSKQRGEGFVDEEWQMVFRREKTREQIFKLIWNVERAPRYRLVKADLRLEAKQAQQDLWKGQALVFLKRDPFLGAEAGG